MAAARKFHSVLIRVQVRNGKEWKSMICIADTGSGVTIFRLTDLSTAIAEYGIEAPCDDLVTADGSTLQGLCGQTAAEMRFHEGSKVHTVTTQVIDKQQMTPILGMDFWQPHNAVFNTSSRTPSPLSQRRQMGA